MENFVELTTSQYNKLNAEQKKQYDAQLAEYLKNQAKTGFDSLTDKEKELFEKTETSAFESSLLPYSNGANNVQFKGMAIVGKDKLYVRVTIVAEDNIERNTIITGAKTKEYFKNALIDSYCTITVNKGYLNAVQEMNLNDTVTKEHEELVETGN